MPKHEKNNGGVSPSRAASVIGWASLAVTGAAAVFSGKSEKEPRAGFDPNFEPTPITTTYDPGKDLQGDAFENATGPAYWNDALQPVRNGDLVLEVKSEHFEAVRELQNLLSEAYQAGLIDSPVTVDGDFGPKTEAAVLEFQQRYNYALQGEPQLYEDGKAGAQTLEALEFNVHRHRRAPEQQPAVDEGDQPLDQDLGNMPVLRRGDRSEDVQTLQALINASELVPEVVLDGDYGGATERAVVAIQNHYGLVADGVAGAKTWAVLIRADRDNDEQSFLDRVVDVVRGVPQEANLVLAKDDPEAFDRTMRAVFRFEGGLSADKDDRGNKGGNVTNLGVTQTAYNRYRDRHDLPRQSTRELTKAEARQLYLEDYWNRASCPELPSYVATVHMDTAVNMGVGRANRILQKCLGVPQDGKIGPQTLSALYAADEVGVLKDYFAERARLYRVFSETGNNKKYLKGWLNRLEHLKEVVEVDSGQMLLAARSGTIEYSPSFSAALEDFQRENGLSVTGELDDDSCDLIPGCMEE